VPQRLYDKIDTSGFWETCGSALL